MIKIFSSGFENWIIIFSGISVSRAKLHDLGFFILLKTSIFGSRTRFIGLGLTHSLNSGFFFLEIFSFWDKINICFFGLTSQNPDLEHDRVYDQITAFGLISSQP